MPPPRVGRPGGQRSAATGRGASVAEKRAAEMRLEQDAENQRAALMATLAERRRRALARERDKFGSARFANKWLSRARADDAPDAPLFDDDDEKADVDSVAADLENILNPEEIG